MKRLLVSKTREMVFDFFMKLQKYPTEPAEGQVLFYSSGKRGRVFINWLQPVSVKTTRTQVANREGGGVMWVTGRRVEKV
jgi:hypothetical protein